MLNLAEDTDMLMKQETTSVHRGEKKEWKKQNRE